MKWNLDFNLKQELEDGEIFSVEQNEKKILRLEKSENIFSFFLLFTEQRREIPMQLQYKLDCAAKQISLLFDGVKVVLVADGYLQDEDFAMGDCDVFGGNVVKNAIEYTLSEQPTKYQEAQIGKVVTQIQHWRPIGYNTGVGDCMPFSHNGVFHVFYLIDRRCHESKWGLGAHQWAHISSTDMKTWQIHPMAIGIDKQWEGSICTGSVMYGKDGKYYAYYATRMSDGSPAKISYAISEDCIHFDKVNETFELTVPYDTVSARDPKVFYDRIGKAHMLVTTSNGKKGEGAGCLAHLTAEDETHFIQEAPFFVMEDDDPEQPECSDFFQIGDWHYLIYSSYMTGYYLMSRSERGPWIKPEQNQIGDEWYKVPKTAEFEGRRIVVGFRVTPERWYGGSMYFMEALQNEDGTLRFVEYQAE